MGVYIVLWDPSSGGELRESLLKEVIPTQISVVCSQSGQSQSQPGQGRIAIWAGKQHTGRPRREKQMKGTVLVEPSRRQMPAWEGVGAQGVY